MKLDGKTEPEVFEILLRIEAGQVARFSFDLDDWVLKVLDSAGQRVACALGATEVRVLQHLLSRPGEVFSKDQLISFAWPGRVVAAGSLTQAIFNIRSFLGADGHSMIVTSPKAGYLFNPDFVESEASLAPAALRAQCSEATKPPLESASVDSQCSVGEEPRRRGIRRSEWLLAIGASLALLMMIGLMTPEIELLVSDPLRIETHRVGGLELKFVTSGSRTTGSELLERSPTFAEGLKGTVWVRVYERRYRVVCYSGEVARAYVAPVQVPLAVVVDQCMKPGSGEA